MPITTLDMLEYANDAAAQAVYVSDGAYSADKIPDMTSNTAPSGEASADTIYSGDFPAWKAMNDSNVDSLDCWFSNITFPHWLKYQFTSGKVIQRYTIACRNHPETHYPGDWTLQGSNNDSDWTTLDTQTGQSFTQAEVKTYSFTNFTSYVYYKINITAGQGADLVAIGEFELMERALQCGSEATIKTQGSYALKGVAEITLSLNDTLTRTVTPTINLSGITRIKFDIRASRTGSNIKIGFHDSGGTTTEHTANIASANVFQTETVNMSAVSNANKDAIDSIIITIVNADAENTFYIDNIYAEAVSGVIFFGCNF